MADSVRYLLEEMVPELEDLERRGFFSRAEIRQIVAKRQDFEYALKRRAALKADYLRYLEYEAALERLRQLRRREIDAGAGGRAAGPSIADHCIVRRMHFIYERMLRKFRGDLSLWAHWLRFCQRTRSTRQTSKVLTRALQLHSSCAALWTHAAAWEFEHNANANAARALMQRGLRMCKGNTSLWHEYFRMEALYAARLAARREVLGIAADSQAAGDGATERVLRGGVAKVVYKSAVAAVPGSLPFRAKFLDVLRPLSLPGKEELEAHILEDIQAAFGGTAQAVDMAARHVVQQGGTLQSALKVFDEAAQSSPSPALSTCLLNFLEEQVQEALTHGDAATVLDLSQRCLKVVQHAAQDGQLSERMMVAAPRIHLRLGQPAAALQCAQELQGGAASVVPVAQRQLMSLQSAVAALGGASETPATHTAGLDAVRQEGSRRRADVWLSAIRTAAGDRAALQRLADELVDQQRGCAKGPVKGGMGAAAACLVQALWTVGDPAPARQLYRSLLALPLPGGDLVHCLLDLELALHQAALPAALSPRQLTELFEAGARAYGEDDVALWLRYHRFEQRRQGGSGAGTIHWRAVKALRDADEFAARAHLVNLGLATV